MGVQVSQIEGGKYEHEADVRDEPLPKSMPEEQHIDADDNGYQGNDANCEDYRSRH